MLVNEATTKDELSRMLLEYNQPKEDDDGRFSNQMNSFSNLQSFNDNFNEEESREKDRSKELIAMPNSLFPQCSFSLIFTSNITYKNFQIMRNQFLLIFKITYPDDFFKKVYEKKYLTIFGLDKSSK